MCLTSHTHFFVSMLQSHRVMDLLVFARVSDLLVFAGVAEEIIACELTRVEAKLICFELLPVLKYVSPVCENILPVAIYSNRCLFESTTIGGTV